MIISLILEVKNSFVDDTRKIVVDQYQKEFYDFAYIADRHKN